MKTIYFIGFMGSGKSTIGQAYADRYDKTYVDTDSFIEAFHEQKISDIFKHSGESTFRIFESEALEKVSNFEVVSTGGGIVENLKNLHMMQKNGIIIYLHASFDEIAVRLSSDQTRPLWNNNVEEKNALYNRRIALYREHADYIVDTDQKTVDDIVQEIEKHLIIE